MSIFREIASKFLINLVSNATKNYFDDKSNPVGPIVPSFPRNASGDLLERLAALLEYLGIYGYLGPKIKDPSQLTIRDILDAVKLFRKMFHLGESEDLLTPDVFRAITYPRCACTDAGGPLGLESEAATSQGYWGLKTLTWYLKKPVRALPIETQKKLINKVYNHIGTICDLSFREVSNENEANLVITCGNSGNGIGSIGGTLAFAYLAPTPNFKGQLQLVMDDAEMWLDTGSVGNGILYENVFYHESLHNLSLSHSSIKSALMAPYYSPSVSRPVSPDDIERLQALYGKPKQKPQPPVVPAPNPGGPVDTGEKMTILLTGNIEIPGYLIVKK